MRATIDLDDPSELDVITAWERLAEHGDGRVYGRVSSSGSGVHLKVHGCDEPTVAYLRRVCGDDTKRIAFDAGSLIKPKQILFSSKPTGDGAGEWSTDREHVLAAYRRRSDVSTRYPGLETEVGRR